MRRFQFEQNSMQPSLISIQVGKPRQYELDGDSPWSSAIEKRFVEGPVFASRIGMAGDKQADLVHHGGPDKAVLAYAFKHYDAWNAELPEVGFSAGGFGENLTIHGLDETTCCLGDVVRIGGCLLQVSQPRQPCWKLSRRWNIPDLAMQVQKNGRSGWYYRVLEEGTMESDNLIELVERSYKLTVAWASSVMYAKPRSDEDDLLLAACPALSASWCETLKNRALGKEARTDKRLYGKQREERT